MLEMTSWKKERGICNSNWTLNIHHNIFKSISYGFSILFSSVEKKQDYRKAFPASIEILFRSDWSCNWHMAMKSFLLQRFQIAYAEKIKKIFTRRWKSLGFHRCGKFFALEKKKVKNKFAFDLLQFIKIN